jgi:DNA-binding NarL/FixJ family response regulator
MTTSVLIVDDMDEVRRDLRTVLSLAEDIEIVGEAANGLEAIRQVETLCPAVVLLDLEMPVLDGYQAASRIKARFPSCRIIVLTVHDYDVARRRALQAGADDVIVKGTPIDLLHQAILERREL